MQGRKGHVGWGGGTDLGHVASLEAALVGDLGVGSALVEDRDLEQAEIGLGVAGTHGTANVLGQAAVQGHLATLETGAAGRRGA